MRASDSSTAVVLFSAMLFVTRIVIAVSKIIPFGHVSWIPAPLAAVALVGDIERQTGVSFSSIFAITSLYHLTKIPQAEDVTASVPGR